MTYPEYGVLVIGTGAAGYNAANRIKQFGKKSVAIITEGVNMGTSRNTGSDKQTYYKLGLGGDSPDSVSRMAHNLFDCGSVDGDTALVEAALSARCFMHLAELGVAFPVNRYGEYVGYKTDHDPFARATSAGPLTSKFMTEALEAEAKKNGVTLLDGLFAVEILTHENTVCGLVCIEKATGKIKIFRCDNIILATGGPAGIYADSVYPECHHGSTGLALNAGAALQNMTEWQFGLASINPRWNVSGTFMQVLPRFVSVDEKGIEREFLSDYFSDCYEALSMVFLKGYQWPFDSKKVLEGSSVIDLLVYRECVLRHRRVYLDYRKNPFGLNEIEGSRLSKEAYDYLDKAGALFGTPIERLSKMNQPAIELYKSKGLDIRENMLEIALCAQHNNGGISVDMWWQTCVNGLFAAGECAGTHGVTRPGGSALNAGQVGSLRAAQYISYSENNSKFNGDFDAIAEKALERHNAFCVAMLKNPDNAAEKIKSAARRMSDCGGAIRETEKMSPALEQILAEISAFDENTGVVGESSIYIAYQLKDILTVQAATLTAMLDFEKHCDGTRGSALYYNKDGDKNDGLEEIFRMKPESGESRDEIQQITLQNGIPTASVRSVRPLPENDDFFENIWRTYRENRNIY